MLFMKEADKKRFSWKKASFQGISLPEADALPAGYAALIDGYDLKVPLPDTLAIISRKHKQYRQGRWAVFTVRHKPNDTLGAHVNFALRYEGVDLAVLKALFLVLAPEELEAIIVRLWKPMPNHAWI
jgi:hypothetical protein